MDNIENVVLENQEVTKPEERDHSVILEVKNLRKCFPVKKSMTGKVLKELVAVDNVSFSLNAGA